MAGKNTSKILVKEFMTKSVITVESSTTINDAAKKMEHAGVGSIIVMENSNPVGIITERDFAIKIAAHAYPIQTKVSQVMSSPVISVGPEESVLETADIMSQKNIRKIPVIKGNEVVGIITATDLLNLFTLCTEEDMKKMYHRFLTKIYDQTIPTL